MTQRDFTEHRLSSEAVFDGDLLHVRRDQVRLPDDSTAMREYIAHPGAAMIVALTVDNHVLLERQFRYPVGRDFYELPAGKRDAGEDPLRTAQRELLEETGYRAQSWRHLGGTYPSVGYSSECIDLFLAQELEHVGANLDEGEFLEVLEVPLQQAVQWIRDGQIIDVKTIAGLLWAEKIVSGIW